MLFSSGGGGCIDSPSIEGVLLRGDMCAVPAHKELDALVEGVQALLCHRGLALLDDVQRVGGTEAQRADVAKWLQAAVWVQAVCQAICRGDRAWG